MVEFFLMAGRSENGRKTVWAIYEGMIYYDKQK